MRIYIRRRAEKRKRIVLNEFFVWSSNSVPSINGDNNGVLWYLWSSGWRIRLMKIAV